MPQSASKLSRAVLGLIFFAVIAGSLVAIDWRQADSLYDRLHQFGRGAGLMGFAVLALQGVLTSRCKLLDRLFAIDRVTNFHKLMGIAAVCLLTAHPVLIMIARQSSALLSMNVPWPVNFGKAALALLWITVTLALMFEVFGLDYNVWRLSHKSAWAIVACGFVHAMLIGHDLQDSIPRTFWWILLMTAAIAAFFRNIYIPFFRRKRYRIDSVTRATHDTFTLTFKPDTRPIQPQHPGQFMFLKLKRPGRKSEMHPFTIASSPTSLPALQTTIKQSGNFTNTIDQTRTSDTAFIEGPYGQFSFLNFAPVALLFIGGGVGITPLMSMLRYLRDTDDRRQVIFLYGNKTRDDIIFQEELNALPGNFTVTNVLSRPDNDWSGLKGYITKDIIAQYAEPVLKTAEVFLCGPPSMMAKVILYLRQLSVPGRRIHYERFTI